MNLREVDLNLLVVLHAMLEHRSVTRAAESIGLSQPAMSAALARLRAVFDDALFVKAGREMRPTPRAAELAGPVQRVVETVKGEILQPSAFDAQTAQRSFTLIAPDIAEIKLLPVILAHFAHAAPGLSLRTLSMPRDAAAQALESGAAELAVGYFPDLSKPGFFQRKLFSNTLVCIVRSDHPSIGASITLKQYLASSHAVVRPEGREHVFDQFLNTRKVQRRVVLEISHFLSLLPIIASSDLIATVPLDLAQWCQQHAAIRLLPAPVKSPVIDVYQFWHRRFHKDPAHLWLRNTLHTLFGA